MELVVGQTYTGAFDGERTRTITKIESDTVTFRTRGVLTFVPSQSSVEQFVAWVQGSPQPFWSKNLPPEGLSQEAFSEAIGLVVKWHDECDDERELVILLFEFFQRLNQQSPSTEK